MSRQEHDQLLTAIRLMLKALKDSGIHGPKTEQIQLFLAQLKARCHANVPPTIATQSDI